MRCLVTGVAGFIGSHLAERLLTLGYEVCGIDAFLDYYPRFIKERNLEILRSWKRFTFIEGDLLNLKLSSLVEGVDWIFHQAAQAGVRASWGQEFSTYVDCNVLATQRLLEAARYAENIQRFVYASSSSIYGDTTTLPVAESMTPQPVSPYGVTKLAAEHLCTLYHRNFGLPTVSLRYFTVYGPRQRPDMAFHQFCKAVIQQHPVLIYEDGKQTRDFTYISDVVEANILAATEHATIGEVFNIAGGSRVTVCDAIQILHEVCEMPVNITFSDKQYGDVRDTFADTTRAKKLMRYQPVVSLAEGLKYEFNYVRSLYENSSATVV